MSKRLLPFFVFCLMFFPLTAGAINPGGTLTPFTGTDLNGKPVDLGKIIGKQPVMLVFWASWCPNCKSEVPKINELYEKFGPQGMSFVGVNVGFNDSVERAKAFVQLTKMAYPVFFDEKSTITKKYGVQGVPTVIVADKKGRVAYKSFGVPEITEENFKQLDQ